MEDTEVQIDELLEEEVNEDEPQILGDIDDEEETQEAEAEKKTEPADDTGYTYYQQQLDQEKGNARRAQAKLDTVTEAYEDAQARIASLQADIEAIKSEKAKSEKQVKLEEMSEDEADPNVIKNIHKLQTQLNDKAKQLDTVLKEIADYKKQQQIQQQNEQKRKSEIEVLDTVEDLFGDAGKKGMAKYRNAANKLADDLVDSGEEPRPKTFKAACKLLAKCYLQIESREASKPKKTSVDTGKGSGGPSGKKSGIKPGKLDDVYTQMLKDRSWLD